MPWYLHLLISAAPVFALALVFLTLHVVTRTTGFRGHAPGWQLRCTTCDATRDAAETGMIRIGATSKNKFLFGHCRHCGGFRWISLERSAPELTSRSV